MFKNLSNNELLMIVFLVALALYLYSNGDIVEGMLPVAATAVKAQQGGSPAPAKAPATAPALAWRRCGGPCCMPATSP